MPIGIGLVGGGENGLLLDIEILANKNAIGIWAREEHAVCCQT